MGKVITVWGSPGSGKSMFCCILAKALTRDKRKAIIINADMNVPMLPVWLPEQIIQTNTSIGQVLSSVEIDTSLVASHVTVLKNYPFIGMMGYAAGENPLSYPEVKYTMVLQLIHAAAKLVDFVILDCSTSMTNVFTPAAIEAGDVVIRILTPDLKGINYLKAHQPLLVDERFRFFQQACGTLCIAFPSFGNGGGMVFGKIPLYILQYLVIGQLLIGGRCEEYIIQITHRHPPHIHTPHHPLTARPVPFAPGFPVPCSVKQCIWGYSR